MNDFPDTSLVQEATKLVTAALSPALSHHSRRTFLLGQAYARVRAIDFDREDLLLAALFHDLGLSDSFADRRKAFTEVGSDMLEDFMTRRGDPRRGRLLAEAIDFHMQVLPRWSKGPVVGLLQVGAWMDVSRLRSGSVGRSLIAEVEAAFPRMDFEPEFNARFRRSIGSFRACARLLLPRQRARARAAA